MGKQIDVEVEKLEKILSDWWEGAEPVIKRDISEILGEDYDKVVERYVKVGKSGRKRLKMVWSLEDVDE